MTVTIDPVSGRIGAVAQGIDLTGPPSADDLATLRQALLDHHVVFLTTQSTDARVFLDFGKRWGDLIADHPAYLAPHDEHPEVCVVSNAEGFAAADTWHADLTYAEPSLGTILQLVTVPPYGGDTMWADRAAAYDELSDAMKVFLDPLVAVHAIGDMSAEQPVVRTLPENGRRALFVNPTFTTRIKGLRLEESEAVLTFLFAHARRPEFEVRWRWTPGDIAMWDNRCTWHYALADHGTAPRVAHRLALAGDQFPDF